MKKSILLLFLSLLTGAVFAQNEAKTAKQFLIMLKVIPQYQEQKNWTERENKLVEAHFANLVRLKENGKLIVAGRTQTDLKTTFGIIIFEADNEEEAKKVMQEDPAVAGGVMSAQLFPYQVALMKDR